MASRLTHHPVYLCSYVSPGLYNHHTIFIVTDDDSNSRPKRGHRLHVIGNLQQGMEISIERDRPPPFGTPAAVGWVRHEGWIRHKDLERAVEICSGVPAPAKQFDGPRRLGQKGVPLRHCQHWAAEALDAMRAEGVLAPLRESDSDELIILFDGMKIKE